MTAKWWAFGLWAAVAASAAAWGLKLFVPTAAVPPHAGVAALAPSPHGDLTRLLGADPVAQAPQAAPESSRFQLLGVVAPRGNFPSREGVALIAVDGKTPKAFRVGAAIEDNLVLKSVAQRGAVLGPRDGDATVTLDIPPPAPAATGVLPPPGAGGAGGAVPNLPRPAGGVAQGFVPPPRAVNLQPPRPTTEPQGEPAERNPGLPTQ